jgi:hypothetical protein
MIGGLFGVGLSAVVVLAGGLSWWWLAAGGGGGFIVELLARYDREGKIAEALGDCFDVGEAFFGDSGGSGDGGGGSSGSSCGGGDSGGGYQEEEGDRRGERHDGERRVLRRESGE